MNLEQLLHEQPQAAQRRSYVERDANTAEYWLYCLGPDRAAAIPFEGPFASAVEAAARLDDLHATTVPGALPLDGGDRIAALEQQLIGVTEVVERFGANMGRVAEILEKLTETTNRSAEILAAFVKAMGEADETEDPPHRSLDGDLLPGDRDQSQAL